MGLAADLATALDPVLLAEASGFTPDPWQAKLLRSTAPRVLVNCSRQSGKSTIAAVLALHAALYDPDKPVLLVSPGERQSKELFKKALAVYRATGRQVPADSETTLWLELATGGRIVALPGKEGTVRSFSGVGLLVIDEASRVPDELIAAVRPMLAVSGGRLIAPSTPCGKRGWWYEAWANGSGWERYEVPATECPRISPRFLAEERRDLGAYWYEQEYLCVFHDAVDAVFRTEDIKATLDPAVMPL